MINPLLPEQISTFWDVIKHAIENSLPPIASDHPDKMNRILGSLLSGKLVCWASYQITEKSRKFNGIIVTDITYEQATDTRSLLIYSLFAYEEITTEIWLEGLQALLKYGKSKKCTNVVAYTTVPHMIDLTKKMGGNADWTYCMFDINSLMEKL